MKKENSPSTNVDEDAKIDRPHQLRPCVICGGVILRDTAIDNSNVTPQAGSQSVPSVM